MDVSLFFNLLFDLIFIALPMDWNQLLSAHRYHPGSTTSLFHSHDRSQFQRDYDRLIFSSPFRRLQNKTQVFPLPGNIFVHNRLTHSLEVASVGRSLGNKVSQFLKQQQVEIENPEILEDWDEKYGDRLNQIVFIGKNLDRDQIISRLQICLHEKSLA